jgi:hypothetical protein
MPTVKMNGQMVTPKPPKAIKPQTIAPTMPMATPKAGLGPNDWQTRLNQVVEAWLMKNFVPGAVKTINTVRNAAKGPAMNWGSGVPGAATGKDVQSGFRVLNDVLGKKK